MALLTLENLRVNFYSRGLDNQVHVAHALNGVDLSISRGEIMGLVGETGAGKSLTAYSAIGLLRGGAQIVDGRAVFEGNDLVGLAEEKLAKLRGKSIALVVQNPKSSLEPLSRIGDQLIRVRRAHSDDTRGKAREHAEAILAAVGIPDPKRRMRAWPHEFSGGMAQRVAIALALINDPTLLIADEPTTGLDVTVQAQILDLMRELVIGRGVSALIITHDLGVVAQYCDRVAVMFAGRVVESGPVEMLTSPVHPYSRALVDAVPQKGRQRPEGGLGGDPPNLYDLPKGCHYQPRCPCALPVCAMPPPRVTLPGSDRQVLCHRALELTGEGIV